MVRQSKATAAKGAVSIFIVMFTTILTGIIVLSFVRLMVLDQQRAINSDLADSAYDSAQIGIVDAKRAILKYEKEICPNDPGQCRNLRRDLLDGNNCDAVRNILGMTGEGEVKIATTEGQDSLEQAYTCAKIKYYTDNYERELKEGMGEHIVLPISTIESTNQLTLEWHTNADSVGYSLSSIDHRSPQWPNDSGWGNRPPVLIVRHIKRGSSVDNATARTLFLTPSANGSYGDGANFGLDVTATNLSNGQNPPVVKVGCNSINSYHCKVTLGFDSNIEALSQNDFLHITKLYSPKTTLRLSLPNSTNRFSGIQPEIDVTGRANYVFRRIKSRVEFTSGLFPYPTAALSVDGDVCKSFEITDYNLRNNSSYTPETGASGEACLID